MNWKVLSRPNINNIESYSLHPVLVEILFRRGIKNQEEINNFLLPDYERDILDPFLFSDMEKAVERIKTAKEKNEKVLVYGDYDADGITSSVILKETLEDLGLELETYIPDKHKEGYGINSDAIEEFSQKGVNLMITVDCGIANAKEIEKINKLGIDVIVTDHHHVPPILPDALAIINPKVKDSGYPFKDLAGVGVAFKVAQAIYKKLMPEKEEQLKWLLDMVAIGTVADLVPLTGENRALVKYGLIVLSKTKRIGLQEIFKVGRISIDENNFPTTEKIAFQIAPRINAASRMDHANAAFYLVLEKERIKAHNFALELESKNQNRQKVTGQVASEIEKIAENSFKDKKFIFAVGEHFPIGIVGLVAGRIADKFNKVTAVLQKGDMESKGSFRSVPQVNIIEAIEKCSDLLIKYGGHSQAAGITVSNKNLEKFYEKLNSIIEKKLEGKKISQEVAIDAQISFDDISFELAEELGKMEPFGEGNREPVFLARNFIVQDLKWVGNGEKHLKLFLRPNDDSPRIFEAIGFNLSDRFSGIEIGNNVDIVFNLTQDEWNGSKKLQLRIVDLKIL